MLQLLLFITLAGQAFGSAIQNPIDLLTRKSYIDEIYGDLVDTPSSREHKSQLLNPTFEDTEPENDSQIRFQSKDPEYLSKALQRKAAHIS